MDKDLEKEIDELFEKAEKEQYVHSRSPETFDNIAGLWFADPYAHEVLRRLACQYITSSCLLKLLELFYKFDFGDSMPPIKSIDLTDDTKRIAFSKATSVIDDKYLAWFKQFVLSAITRLLDKVSATDLEEVARLGNCADSAVTFAQHAIEAGEDAIMYDSLFYFVSMILEE